VSEDRPAVQIVDALTVQAPSTSAAAHPAVPVEAPLAVPVNGVVVAHLMRLPGHDAELALGFCYSEGLISGLADVLSVETCEDETGRVTVRTPREVAPREPAVLTSACVGPRGARGAELPPAVDATGPKIRPDVLLQAGRKMQAAQETHRTAGAVHAAAIFTLDGKLVVLREDVGRHNAIDKVIGHCLYQDCPLARTILVSTGRASSEMILKTAAARVPVAASRSGPTSLGVELAEKLGVTLVGYLRHGQMTLYAHPQRLSAGRRPGEVASELRAAE
jgi:FdhD protein